MDKKEYIQSKIRDIKDFPKEGTSPQAARRAALAKATRDSANFFFIRKSP